MLCIERQSRYNDHHFEQLNEQLLLVTVSYIIYNIFFLCYVKLFSTLLIILVNEIICN